MKAGRGWVAVVNPSAGGGRSPATIPRLVSELEHLVDEVLVSQHAGHIESLMRRAEDADGVLVLGGDGTVFEVLQRLDRARQRLAVLPAGRGNSLMRDLGLASARDVIASMASGRDREIDLLGVDARFADGRQWSGVSASNLALGYPAEVARGAAAWRRWGTHSYTMAAVIANPRWIGATQRLDGAQARDTRFTGLIASKSRYVGPFLGFPRADLRDGVCHLMWLGAGKLRQTLHNLSAVSGLQIFGPKGVAQVRSSQWTLEEPTLLKIDGELLNDVVQVDVRVLPRALTVRIPSGHE